VKCEFRIVTGGRAGHREVFDKSYIGCGRHPLSDLRFEPEKDLDVSAKHAAVLRSGERYVLRDLGSRNGTFVNNRKVEADYELADGDVVRFGLHGPEVEFRVAHEGAEQVIEAVRVPTVAPAPGKPPGSGRPPASGRPPSKPPGAAARPSATSVLRAQVSAQRARYRALLIALGVVIIGAVAVVLWQGRTAEQQVATLGTAIDSLSREVQALRIAQARADSEARALRAELATERDPTRRAALQQTLTVVQRQQRSISAAQGVNWAAINRANARAVAILYVKFPDTTQMWTGTAFSISADGLLLTNRHVVINDQNQRPRDIAVQFPGSKEVLRARIDQVAPDVDLATVRITDVVKIADPGPYPVVRGIRLDASAEVGDPIALIGYPLGTDAPMGGSTRTPTVRTTLAPGTIAKILPDSLLQLDAYSATGASGSPILDRDGRVIGVEFGGLRESEGRVVLGLPIKRAAALLPAPPP
jgi:S1-C subfamily serine protease